MFCINCGEQLRGDELFCGNCGQKKEQNLKSESPKRFLRFKMTQKMKLTLVAVIFVGGAGMFFSGGNNNPQDVIHHFMKSIEKKDFEGYLNLVSQDYKDEYNSEDRMGQSIKSGLFLMSADMVNSDYGYGWADRVELSNIVKNMDGLCADIILNHEFINEVCVQKEGNQYVVKDAFSTMTNFR